MIASVTPVFIGLLGVTSVAVVLLLHYCILVTCCNGNRYLRRRRPRAGAPGPHRHENGLSVVGPNVDSNSADVSTMQLVVVQQPAVVCPFRKEEQWAEATCPVCLSDFGDGEAVRVLPECMHYFHVEYIETWLRTHSSCQMCRTEATPSPSPGSMQHRLPLPW